MTTALLLALVAGLLLAGAVLARALMAAQAKARRAVRDAEQKARAAERARDELIANISHELRTPMNGILGMADLLLSADLPTAEREKAQIVSTSANAMLNLIDDLLDLSRIRVGKLTLHRFIFSLAATTREVVHSLRPEAQAKKLELTLSVDEGVPDALEGDAARLRQVLLHLAGNAIKFTPEGGRVDIRIERAADPEPPLWLRFVVSDTGIGIAPEVRERLFAPFAQAESSADRRFGGIGLGLHLSRSLVRLLGGEIGLESGRAQGSAFWFRLPLGRAGVPVPPPVQTRPGPAARILIVEDNEVNQKVSALQVQALGYESRVVPGGHEALAALARERFDLILMDCQMPVLDGYETTRLIRRDPTFNRIPIVALTAHALDGDREKCLAAGMDDYLQKPLTRRELAPLLENWLGQGRSARTPEPAA